MTKVRWLFLALAMIAGCSAESESPASASSVTTSAGGGGADTGSGGTAGAGGSTAAGGSGGAEMEQLLLGIWQEPPPTAYLRFDEDHTAEVASTIAELDTNPFAEAGWTLDGSTLTFVNTAGVCSTPPQDQPGIYAIAVTATELTFTMIDDACPARNVIDGQTWTRVP